MNFKALGNNQTPNIVKGTQAKLPKKELMHHEVTCDDLSNVHGFNM
jgi:hypothetical protein